MREKTKWGSLDPFFEGGDILGRKVANRSFLDGLLTADPFNEYHFFPVGKEAADALASTLRDTYPALSRREAFQFALRAELPNMLAKHRYHCFHLSDFVERHVGVSLLRNKYSEHIFPVTSVTHSLSYKNYMPHFLAHAWGGVSTRDAVVGTSQSARRVLKAAFADLAVFYGETLGHNLPALPVIPLGVDAAGREPPHEVVKAMRARLGLDKAPALVFLSLSRICAQSKMDFLPILSACKRAEEEGMAPGSYCLVLAGWVEDEDPLPEALAAMARHLGIRFHAVPHPTEEERDALYHVADVFLSPSDNIQETFGLTVIEAGAAGLPVIASDFDGYRDTVVDGVTGILVPTLGFARSDETNVQAFLWMDNQYHLKLAQQTAVDVPCMAKAMACLAKDAELRERMGEKARAHVEKNFSWTGIIKQYCALWDELWKLPISAEEEAVLRRAEHPLQMNFARLFKGHFSQTLTAQTVETLTLQRTSLGDACYRGLFPDLPYAGLELMLDREALHRLLFMARKPLSAKRLLDQLLDECTAGGIETEDGHAGTVPRGFARERMAFTLLWALKHDLLERV